MDWQPIETAPKDGTVIDLWIIDRVGEGDRHANCRWDDPYGDGEDAGWRQEYAEARGSTFPLDDERERITHWMSLPKPPPV